MTPTTPQPGEPLNGESVRLLPCQSCSGHGRLYKNGVRPYVCSSCGGSGELPTGPTAQADKTAPAFDWTAATNAAWAENNPTPSAPSRMASDAPAEGAGEAKQRLIDQADAYEIGRVEHFEYHGMVEDLRAALTQAAPADPVAGEGEPVAWRMVPVEPTEAMIAEGRGWAPTHARSYVGPIYSAMIAAALSPSPGVTDKLVEALEATRARWKAMIEDGRLGGKAERTFSERSISQIDQALAAARQTEEGA